VWKLQKRKNGITIRYTDKEKILLDYIDKEGAITLSKFRKIAAVSRMVAEKVLVDLIVLRIINMEITEKAVYYHINPDVQKES
jgi:predicted HTH transcriptional regulator